MTETWTDDRGNTVTYDNKRDFFNQVRHVRRATLIAGESGIKLMLIDSAGVPYDLSFPRLREIPQGSNPMELMTYGLLRDLVAKFDDAELDSPTDDGLLLKLENGINQALRSTLSRMAESWPDTATPGTSPATAETRLAQAGDESGYASLDDLQNLFGNKH